MNRGMIALVAALVPGVSAGQTALPAAPAAASARHTMMRAAGMPLNDGALAPGMLTVRIVQGAFTNNLAGQIVTVEVTGGNTETATTGPDGRAQFAHLSVGSQVRAAATVNGEPLTSDIFPMPVDSGVRVLLVAGGDAAGEVVASRPASDAFAVPLSSLASDVNPPNPQSQTPAATDGVLIILVVLTCATLLWFAWLIGQRWAPLRRGRAVTTATSAPLANSQPDHME